jgi:hypothetical protein
MAMEDPDAILDDAVGRTDLDLARKVRHDPPVMVPEDEFCGEPFGKKPTEEIEDHGTQRGRSTDDRMLHVPRDEDPIRRGDLRDPGQLLGEGGSGAFRGTVRTVRAAP